MRYAGQSYDLAIDLGVPWGTSSPDGMILALIAAFHTQHERRYAYCSEEEKVEIVQIRVSVRGPVQIRVSVRFPPFLLQNSMRNGVHAGCGTPL